MAASRAETRVHFDATQAARIVGVTLRTVQRDWAKARALLQRALAP